MQFKSREPMYTSTVEINEDDVDAIATFTVVPILFWCDRKPAVGLAAASFFGARKRRYACIRSF